jgi:hypothetical protein
LLGAILIQPALAGDMGQKMGEGHMQTMVGTINKDARFETPEGEEYLVVGKMAEDVIVKQGEKVKVSGMVRTEGDGKAIAVQHYMVLDDYEFQQELEKQKMKDKDM